MPYGAVRWAAERGGEQSSAEQSSAEQSRVPAGRACNNTPARPRVNGAGTGGDGNAGNCLLEQRSCLQKNSRPQLGDCLNGSASGAHILAELPHGSISIPEAPVQWLYKCYVTHKDRECSWAAPNS